MSFILPLLSRISQGFDVQLFRLCLASVTRLLIQSRGNRTAVELLCQGVASRDAILRQWLDDRESTLD